MEGNGFEPKILICVECNEEFIFTPGAQQYFMDRGYTEDPKRCKNCHTQYKKQQREQSGRTSQTRTHQSSRNRP